MTVWGGFTNHLRIGLDVWTDAYNSYTPSINVYMTWHVQCDSSWNFNDAQSLVMTSPQGNTWNFQNTEGPNGDATFGWTIYGQGQSYGGGPTYHFGAQLNGVYLGAGPSFGWDWALPARPIRPPAPPSSNPAFSSITAQSVFVSWGGTSDAGGSTPDQDWLQVATDSGFGNVVYSTSQGGSSRSVGGLAPGTTYYARSAIHNGAGWSGWSGTTAFATNAYQLAAPTLSAVAATTTTVNWGNPPTADAPSQYNLQIATDSGFSHLVGNFTAGWAKTFNATGLVPGTTYYYRVRASTSTGWGAFSPAVSSKTLSGAKVRQAGAWKDAVAFVRVGGAWKQATVNKRVGGVWKL